MMKVYAESGSGRTATNGGLRTRQTAGAARPVVRALRRAARAGRGRTNTFAARRGRNG